MTIGIVLLAISMGLDVFAGGLAYGIGGLPRERWQTTALIFAACGVGLLALGLVVGELLDDRSSDVASYIAGVALVLIGINALRDTLKPHENLEQTKLPLKISAIVLTGIVVSLDKLAIGVSLAAANVASGWILIYAAALGLTATYGGLLLGKRLGSKIGEAAHGLSGCVFVLLGALIIYQTASSSNPY
jgi:putative Mn2+ efflux pump MntP